VTTECKILALQWNRKILAAPLGSVGIFLTAVESIAYVMRCCEVTDLGSSHKGYFYAFKHR